ncbi:MAG: hypothetical protein M3P04_11835, partial [Actinomycetota bacterium]|nr:hypothetical protein [Actinomycetota bacterium]
AVDPVISPPPVDETIPAAGRRVEKLERRYLRDSSPWRSRDVVRCLSLMGLGLGGLLACGYGLTGEAAWRDQIPWGIGALAGTGVFVLGGVSWLLAGMRAVRQGVRELELDRRRVLGLHSAGSAEQGLATHELVTADGMRQAHRPDCLLVRGKAVRPAATAAQPCKVCAA